MAIWKRTDGTKIEFESWDEHDRRLTKVAADLYRLCKEQNLTGAELKKVTEILRNMAEHLPL